MSPRACWPPAGTCRPARLLAAYQRGIFPWYSPGQPVLWWSPDPRAVLFPEEFQLLAQPRQDAAQRRLRRSRSISDFAAVIDGCAAPRAREPRHLDHARDARRLPASCTAWAMRTASRPSATARSSAASTACGWAGCSSANRCSAASAMPRKSRWRAWWRSAVAAASRSSTASCPRAPGEPRARAIPRSQFQALLREHVRAAARCPPERAATRAKLHCAAALYAQFARPQAD